MQTRLPPPTLDFPERTRLRITILYNKYTYIYIYVRRDGATPARAGRLGETLENVSTFFFIVICPIQLLVPSLVHVDEFKIVTY